VARRIFPVASLLWTAAGVTLALSWLVLTLYRQQQALERQQISDIVARAADAMSADVRSKLVETGELLSAWLLKPGEPLPAVDGIVVVAIVAEQIAVQPPHALPFVPVPVSVRDPSPAVAAAERLEFGGDRRLAVEVYERLSRAADRQVQAEARLRLGRIYLQAGRMSESVVAFQELASYDPLTVDGYPASFAALEGQRRAFGIAADRRNETRTASEIIQGIDSGRWPLSRRQAALREQLTSDAPPSSWAMADAIVSVWEDMATGGEERGVAVAGSMTAPMVVVWRTNPRGTIAAAAPATRFLPARTLDNDVSYELTDAASQRIAGSAAPHGAVVRVTGDTRTPWTLRAWTTPDTRRGTLGLPPSAQIIGLAGIVTACLWVSVYFVARAMRREARLAQLQSDFVSAVSHEFRTPLTTVRQLAELLDMGETGSEERRRTYYSTLVSEARRLQRLVETLLNFGRMEAGAHRYRSDRVDVAALVRDVVAELDGRVGNARSRVSVHGPFEGPYVTGDPEALALAVRNLLDNALKYSAERSGVRVEWSAVGHDVVMHVIDHGPGIEPTERNVIFERFVRGQAAIAAVVPGTGVGLAMVRHVVAAHGGSVTLDSRVGHGSTFTLVLPMAA
jgi:signal transduction histidine kinase